MLLNWKTGRVGLKGRVMELVCVVAATFLLFVPFRVVGMIAIAATVMNAPVLFHDELLFCCRSFPSFS